MTPRTSALRLGGQLRRPSVIGVLGAVCIAFSAPLVALSGTTASTATFYRCVLAVPILAVLGVLEWRRHGTRRWKDRLVATTAGALLAGDLLLWSQSIGEVGAGISTVVVNLQVVLVPLIALAVDRERLTRRFLGALAPMLIGVALAAGVGVEGSGDDPVLGTVHASLAAVCYAGYLYLLRRSSGDGSLVGPVLDATVAATVVAVVAGWLWQGIDVTPGWAAFGWLVALALSGQVVGWLFIALALARLPSRVGAALLLLQPVGAVALGVVLLSERPTGIQILGCVLVLGAVLVVSTDPARRRPADVRERATDDADDAGTRADRDEPALGHR